MNISQTETLHEGRDQPTLKLRRSAEALARAEAHEARDGFTGASRSVRRQRRICTEVAPLSGMVITWEVALY